ncbi:MAG: helix-turn-helix domain-containing protein [Lachnospiraceae bacterium]|nr:helix-turn-helix domain-containing protein [Lachnospiraceae bacterium]
MSDNKFQGTEIITTFGERLDDLLQERNLTREQFANKLGMTRQTLSDYINNPLKDLSFSFVRKMAIELGVSIDYLAGLKNNKSRQDTPIEALMLTDEAVNAVENANYERALLSEILENPNFELLMLDLMVLVSQRYSVVIANNNSQYSYTREEILKLTKGREDFNTRTLAAFVVDGNTFIKETIRKDLDTILDDMVKKHHKKEMDDVLSQIKTNTESNIELGREQAKKSEANIGSRKLLAEQLLSQISIPIDKITDEQMNTIIDIIKLSPVLESGINQRGKK